MAHSWYASQEIGGEGGAVVMPSQFQPVIKSQRCGKDMKLQEQAVDLRPGNQPRSRALTRMAAAFVLPASSRSMALAYWPQTPSKSTGRFP
jgi:hypothetical protein